MAPRQHRRPVVLVYPRHTRGWEAQPWRDLPLGLLHVASPVLEAGHPVTVIDQRTDHGWQSTLRREMTRDPVCVGISTSTGPQLLHALEVSREVRRLGPAPVVWGGVHATALPETTLAEECVDIVVLGEGEETFLELVTALDRGSSLADVAGLAYRENGHVARTSDRPFVDLDRVPPPDLSLVDASRYVRTVFGTRRLLVTLSRGCPNACSFCVNTSFHRRRWRGLSPEVAVGRLKALVEETGIRGVLLSDSNFFADLDWGREVLRGVIREGLNLVFTRIQVCLKELRRLTDDDLDLLRRAGCRCLSMGVESGSARIRRLLRKPIDEEQLHDVNRRLAATSMHALYFFMMGFPGETRDELAATVGLARTLLAENRTSSVSLNIACPFPGTELYDLALRHGFEPPASTEGWAGLNYRRVSRRAPWISPQRRRLIQMLDFCWFFQDGYKPFKKTHPLASLAVHLYSRVADYRVRRLDPRLPVDVVLARRLGLYGRQR